MNTGTEITSQIISLAYGGDGIIREKNLTGFIRGVIPGELVKSKVIEVRKNYFRSKPVEIIEKSQYRIAPPCPYFNRCGGCVYQHITYEKQIEFKSNQLEELLGRIGKTASVEISAKIPSPMALGYRNQLSLKLKSMRGAIELGFLGFDNKTFIPVERCLIAKDAINKKIPEIKKELTKGSKIKKLDGEIIIKCGSDDATDYGFAESISAKGEYKLLHEEIDSKVYYFSLASFFQTNPYILPPLLSELKNTIAPSPDETLFDLYCGTGLFSIYFSPYIKNTYGIELNTGAVKLAQKTADKNGIRNCKFFQGDAEELFTEIFNKHKTGKNIIILDPPRAGLNSAILKCLQEIKIQKLVYISCEPSKLARDLNILLAGGYEIKNIIVADMFPQTKHMETLAILTHM